jgi:hypothetical protein
VRSRASLASWPMQEQKRVVNRDSRKLEELVKLICRDSRPWDGRSEGLA